MKKQLWVIAGPNGAGKSTLADAYIKDHITMINPDDIARKISPDDTSNLKVIFKAGKQAILRQNALLAKGDVFALESTFSGKRELVLMEKAKTMGYKVNLVFVGIPHEQSSLERVLDRVKKGGHSVSLRDIKRRYSRSMDHLSTAISNGIPDRLFILDNSGKTNRLFMVHEKNKIKFLSNKIPLWARPAIDIVKEKMGGQ